MVDQRITKTKQKLYHALGELLKEKSFDEVTVSELVKRANTTRKTFYNHYQDKIDLVQEYQEKLTGEIQEILSQYTIYNEDFFIQLFTYLDEQDELLNLLLSPHGSSELQAIIKETMEMYCKKQMESFSKDVLLLEYQAVLMANVIFGTIQHWMSHGKKTTPKETAEIVERLRFPLGQI